VSNINTALFTALLFSCFSILSGLENSMLRNLFLSYPLIIYLGWLVGMTLAPKRSHRIIQTINMGGITGLIVASFALAFWMIPRWMDAAVSDTVIQIVKHTCLFFLVGLPLGYSWSSTNFIIRGFIKIELLGMLLRLGWVYVISPVRLCNNYSLNEQYIAGQAMIWLAVALAVYYVTPLFISQPILKPQQPQMTPPSSTVEGSGNA